MANGQQSAQAGNFSLRITINLTLYLSVFRLARATDSTVKARTYKAGLQCLLGPFIFVPCFGIPSFSSSHSVYPFFR